MGKFVADELTAELLPLLQKERFVTISSMNRETGAPHVTAISWIYAPHAKHIRIAVSSASQTARNVASGAQKVALNLIGAGSCYTITGLAEVGEPVVEGIPVKISRIDITVNEVRDVMFSGARVASEPVYEKVYDKEAAEKLDGLVMRALMETKDRPSRTSV